MMNTFSDLDMQARADEAAVYNENLYRYLTEEEQISSDVAYRMVYGD